MAGFAATIWSSKVPFDLSLWSEPIAAMVAKYWITRFVFTVLPVLKFKKDFESYFPENSKKIYNMQIFQGFSDFLKIVLMFSEK